MLANEAPDVFENWERGRWNRECDDRIRVISVRVHTQLDMAATRDEAFVQRSRMLNAHQWILRTVQQQRRWWG
jgi:hypothetical protein